jgi:hypothetical protein
MGRSVLRPYSIEARRDEKRIPRYARNDSFGLTRGHRSLIDTHRKLNASDEGAHGFGHGHRVDRYLVDRFGRGVGSVVDVDEAEGALEQVLDVLFADELGSEEFVEIEIGEAAIGDACGQQLQQ